MPVIFPTWKFPSSLCDLYLVPFVAMVSFITCVWTFSLCANSLLNYLPMTCSLMWQVYPLKCADDLFPVCAKGLSPNVPVFSSSTCEWSLAVYTNALFYHELMISFPVCQCSRQLFPCVPMISSTTGQWSIVLCANVLLWGDARPDMLWKRYIIGGHFPDKHYPDGDVLLMGFLRTDISGIDISRNGRFSNWNFVEFTYQRWTSHRTDISMIYVSLNGHISDNLCFSRKTRGQSRLRGEQSSGKEAVCALIIVTKLTK